MSKNQKPRKKYHPRFVGNPLQRFDHRAQVSLALMHYQLVDAMATGEANAQTMYDFCHAVYTWSKLARANDQQECELLDKAGDMCNAMVDRFNRIGKVVLTGPELQVARDIAGWMDEKVKHSAPDRVMDALVASRKDLQRRMERLG